MVIYVGMVLWILFLGAVCRKRMVLNSVTGQTEYSATSLQAFLSMAIVVFFIGLRSSGADTGAYISGFQSLPTGISSIIETIKNGESEAGFAVFGILVKTFLSEDFHVYLFLIAAISGFCVVYALKKYSQYFTTSMLLFMLMGTFTWMINGIRQFLAVSIAFAAVGLILKRKMIPYILLILFLTTIHTSVILLLPIYFIVEGEAWNKRTMLVLGLSIAVIFFTTRFTSFLDSALVGTNYEGAVDQFAMDDGSNPIRTMINAVPVVIAFVNRRTVKQKGSAMINVCINMSIIGVALSIVANVTSGILMGRLPIYFTIYNLILLPWLVYETCGKFRDIIYFAMIVCYAFSFYYENFVTNHYYYASDILHMYFW